MPQEERADRLAIAPGVELTQRALRGRGPIGESLSGEALDELLDRLLVQLAGAQALQQVEGEQRDRVGIRIVAGPGTGAIQRRPQSLDRGLERVLARHQRRGRGRLGQTCGARTRT